MVYTEAKKEHHEIPPLAKQMTDKDTTAVALLHDVGEKANAWVEKHATAIQLLNE